MFSRVTAAAVLIAFVSSFSATQAATNVDIGVAAAVRPQATGTPPEQDARILHVGVDLFADERIETGGSGQTHLLFRDGSSISIGPNASLLLDEFVYDPDSKTGALAVSVTKGVFRFVGGRISKKTPVLFKTPTAVIGVRGGVAMMDVNAPEDVAAAQQQGETLNPANVTMLYGDEVFMDNGQDRQTLTRPGSIMSQTPAGTFTPPRQATQQQLNAALSTLEEPQQSEDEDSGGAGGLGAIAPAAGGPAVSDTDVSDSQLSDLGSNNSPQSIGGATPAAPAPNLAAAGSSATNASQEQAKEEAVSARDSGTTDEEEEDEETGTSSSGSGSGSESEGESPVVTEGSGEGETSAPGTSVTIVGRARCCETNGTGTDDGNALRDFIVSDATFSTDDNLFSATGPNGAFDLSLPGGNGVFAVGASTATPFDSAGFGTVLGGTVTVLFNQEFAFYELNGTTGARAILLAGTPTPESALPSSGFSIYGLFDDITGTDSPNATQAPFVRHSSTGATNDNSKAYFIWNDNAAGQRSFGVGRVVISGTGTSQVAAASVITGSIQTSTGGKTYLDGYQRGSLRISAGNPRHFDGRIASLPLSDDGNHFLVSDFPSGFQLGAATANDGNEPIHTGITRRHGDGSHDFTDRPNSVGYLTSHSATSANSRTQDSRYGYGGGVMAIYLDSATSTAPNAYRPFIANDTPPAILPGFSVTSNINFDQIDSQFNGSIYDDDGVDASLVLNFGGNGNAGRSIFIDDKIFMAIEDPGTPGTTNGGNSVFALANTRTHLTTAHNFEFDSSFQGGTTFCTCSFLTWGFMGFDTVEPQSSDLWRSQLATWVIGTDRATNISQFPNGNATYSGHVIGTIGQGSSVYAAVGDLDMTLSFTAGQVSVTSGSITGFDGGNYAMSNVGGINNFGVAADLTLTGKSGYNPGDITGRLAGSFFGTGSPPENFAGNFRLERIGGTGQDYDAAGIAMAEKQGFSP